ncbi:repetitive organellar protein-like isoform X2 [Mytilus trossulus]|uniref:repetitive organellar protein-like isoform X2 n=1 Tax=Mytilus trossulus TaxID=6551 RepID=UPI003005D3EF
MASSKPISGGPCKAKRFKGTRDHKTIDIKNYNPSVQTIKTECDKHDQQLTLYCPSHLIPCCDECISNTHMECTGIKSLASIVEKTKIEKSKESVEKEINSILQLLGKIVNNKSQNIKRGEQEYESIKEFIVKIRNEIDEHLTHLEKKIYQEADNILNQEKSKATDLITEIEEKQKILKKMQDQLHTVMPHASKLQSFLGVHQIEQQVHQCQRYIDDLENDDRAKKFNIKMEENNETEKIIKKLESLGELTVVKTDMDLNRETSVRMKAQVESREKSNINNMTMNIEKKIKTNMDKEVSDMICLSDGRLIMVEWLGKVKLLTPDGKTQKHLPIPGGAFSVTQINQDTIAVTYPWNNAIKIFNMENETVTKVITLDKQCRGLSSSDNSLVVGLSDDEIRIIDLEGNTLKSIQVECESHLNFIVYCNDRVIYSDHDGIAVNCVDQSGKQIWQYTQDLSGPWGFCTDTYGNIIVADTGSHRIIVISKDGKDSKVLLSDGLENPGCICLKQNESSGFICDNNGKDLTKITISSE